MLGEGEVNGVYTAENREKPRSRRYNRSSPLRSLFQAAVSIILLCGMLTGCGSDPTIWSASSPSPDGHWVALARTVQHTGPGANGVETNVEVKQLSGLRRTTRILSFMNDGNSLELKMDWTTPSHLDVQFKGDPKVLYFQVVKTSGVDISVHNLSSH